MRLSGFCFQMQISGWSQVWMFGSDWKTSRFWFLSPSQFSWTSCRMFVWTRSGSLLVSEVGPAGCLLGAGFPPLAFTLGFISSEKQLRQETDCSGRHQIIFVHSRGVFLFLSAVLENTRQLSNVYEAAVFGNRTGCGGWWMKIQFILLYFFSHDRRFCYLSLTERNSQLLLTDSLWGRRCWCELCFRRQSRTSLHFYSSDHLQH